MPTTLVPCVESRVIPCEPFPELTLREAAVPLPTVVPDARANTASMRIPLFTLPRSLGPLLSVTHIVALYDAVVRAVEVDTDEAVGGDDVASSRRRAADHGLVRSAEDHGRMALVLPSRCPYGSAPPREASPSPAVPVVIYQIQPVVAVARARRIGQVAALIPDDAHRKTIQAVVKESPVPQTARSSSGR